MSKLVRYGNRIAILMVCGFVLATQSGLTAQRMPRESHNDWLAHSLSEIQTVKVGMKRRDVLRLFTTEGGFSSSTSKKYVYKGSLYIKVDIQFQSAGPTANPRESLDDEIVQISKPYLEYPVSD